jgi:hypothetical protein
MDFAEARARSFVRRRTDRVSAVLGPTLVVALGYAAWAIHVVVTGKVADLALVGRKFLARGHGHSAAIDALAPHAHSTYGYDGQAALFLALDPAQAHHYLDEPVYRSSRALYPAAARLAAIGRPEAVPYALVLINVAAAIAGTLLLAILLRRRGVSPWLSLVYGLSPALFVAVDRDLTEPLAYALAIGAILAIDSGRLLAGAAVFGLAGLARETTLLFAAAAFVALAFGLATERLPWRRVLAMSLIAFAPYVVLRAGLARWLGPDPPPGAPLELVPFRGLAGYRPFSATQAGEVLVVVIPALVALVVICALVRRLTPEVLAVCFNVVGLVALMPRLSYDTFISSGRVSIGVPIAVLLALPLLRFRWRADLLCFVGLLWLLPWSTVAADAIHA